MGFVIAPNTIKGCLTGFDFCTAVAGFRKKVKAKLQFPDSPSSVGLSGKIKVETNTIGTIINF